MKEITHADTDVRNGTQTSAIFKLYGQLNIFFASSLLCQFMLLTWMSHILISSLNLGQSQKAKRYQEI